MIDKIINKQKYKIKNDRINKLEQRYVAVEYGENIHFTLKNELKKQNVVLACRTTNKLDKHFTHKPKQNNDINKYNGTGVYEISCSDCNKKYFGQTGRSFT